MDDFFSMMIDGVFYCFYLLPTVLDLEVFVFVLTGYSDI